MTKRGPLEGPSPAYGFLQFEFAVPNLFLLTLMPLGAIIIAFAAYLIAFGTADRTSWRLTEPAIGSDLHIGVYVGGCDRFDRIVVRERESVVLVAAYLRNDARDNCDDILNFEPRTVQLRAPLGGRALHGCNPPNSAYKETGYSDDDCADTYPQ